MKTHIDMMMVVQHCSYKEEAEKRGLYRSYYTPTLRNNQWPSKLRRERCTYARPYSGGWDTAGQHRSIQAWLLAHLPGETDDFSLLHHKQRSLQRMARVPLLRDELTH